MYTDTKEQFLQESNELGILETWSTTPVLKRKIVDGFECQESGETGPEQFSHNGDGIKNTGHDAWIVDQIYNFFSSEGVKFGKRLFGMKFEEGIRV